MNPLFTIGTKTYYVYIITNPSRTVLYTGMCDNLRRRLEDHFNQRGRKDTFAGKYYCYVLLYYESYGEIQQAILREKQIKGWRRSKKEALIASHNPKWEDLKFTI